MDFDAQKLLYLIEARSPIYNYKDKEHANKITIQNLWLDIAAKMNCPVSQCKNKWTLLRNAYARYLRETSSNPSELNKKQKKKWYLADAMSFLKGYMNQYRSTRNSLDIPDVEEVIYEIMEVESPASLNESAQLNTSDARNSPVPSKRSRNLVSQMVAGQIIEFFQSKTREEAPENGNALFFKSLLADYEKLSSRRQRSFRMHMLNKMNELQEEEENDAANTSTASSVSR